MFDRRIVAINALAALLLVSAAPAPLSAQSRTGLHPVYSPPQPLLAQIDSARTGLHPVYATPQPLLAQIDSGRTGLHPVFASPQPLLAQIELPGLAGDIGQPGSAPQVDVRAVFTRPTADQPAKLYVTADIPNPYHIYSITQPAGGPQKTSIRLDPSPHYKLTDDFQAHSPPKTHVDQTVWVGLRIEEHEGRVTWSAPVQFSPSAELATLSITGTVDTQACTADTCVPLTVLFSAQLGARPDTADTGTPATPPQKEPVALEGPTFEGQYRPDNASVTIRGVLRPATVINGGNAELILSAEPDPNWHVYALADRDPKEISKPTLIVIDSPGSLRVYRAQTDARVIEKDQTADGLGVQRYYEGPVRWTVPLEVPDALAPGQYTLGGIIGYQVCTDQECKPPTAARFQVTVQVANAGEDGERPVTFAKAYYGQAAQLAEQTPPPPLRGGEQGLENILVDGDQGRSLATMLVFAFLGGLILNLMPCVLPVIGLKVMSFVEQAGQSRAQAVVLNLWYAAGLVSVFLALATFAVAAGLTWGQQFGNDIFNIVLASVVFAMALSLLGVWELPIPGFVGGNQAAMLAEKEGPWGAFVKGVLTTVLATPCTGPFMGTALSWAVRQPPAVTYAVFASLGIGMASPYLVIGAFPNLLRWIPKPGEWMVTFKQVMGFILIGTVIFVMTFIHPALIVPTAVVLAAVAAACWWISRTQATAPIGTRIVAWAQASALVALVSFFTFNHLTIGGISIGGLDAVMQYRLDKYVSQSGGDIQLHGGENHLPWEPFSRQKLDALTGSGQTVLVDFTADWCSTCKTLEKFVLNTAEIKEVVTRNGVVPLLADYTRYPDHIKEMLEQLQSNGVPVLAIFPADRPTSPIVFRGYYSKADLINALQQAGPSSARSEVAAAAKSQPPSTAIAR